MTRSAVAARYAEALADVVSASGSTLRPEDAVTQVRAFAGVLQSSPELHNVLTSPGVPSSRKKAVVGRIADALQLSRITRNFLFVLIDHRRIADAPEILHTLELVLDERMGFVRAEVSSAGELTETQRSGLNNALEHLSGKRIRMRFTVDGSLIGGVVARIGSTVYDGSLRGRLHSLARQLSAED